MPAIHSDQVTWKLKFKLLNQLTFRINTLFFLHFFFIILPFCTLLSNCINYILAFNFFFIFLTYLSIRPLILIPVANGFSSIYIYIYIYIYI
jgi:hypothetical protein